MVHVSTAVAMQFFCRCIRFFDGHIWLNRLSCLYVGRMWPDAAVVQRLQESLEFWWIYSAFLQMYRFFSRIRSALLTYTCGGGASTSIDWSRSASAAILNSRALTCACLSCGITYMPCIRIYTCTCIHTCRYVNVHVWIRVCIYEYVWMYTYTWIKT